MTDDGGPAFPKPCDECSHFPFDSKTLKDAACKAPQSGMSLRDWLAGMAITYIGYMKISSARLGIPIEEQDWTQAGIATMCYEIAEAMLAERKKHSEQETPP